MMQPWMCVTIQMMVTLSLITLVSTASSAQQAWPSWTGQAAPTGVVDDTTQSRNPEQDSRWNWYGRQYQRQAPRTGTGNPYGTPVENADKNPWPKEHDVPSSFSASDSGGKRRVPPQNEPGAVQPRPWGVLPDPNQEDGASLDWQRPPERRRRAPDDPRRAYGREESSYPTLSNPYPDRTPSRGEGDRYREAPYDYGSDGYRGYAYPGDYRRARPESRPPYPYWDDQRRGYDGYYRNSRPPRYNEYDWQTTPAQPYQDYRNSGAYGDNPRWDWEGRRPGPYDRWRGGPP
jgi:hypothetical protein